jgi:hypothetical protein
MTANLPIPTVTISLTPSITIQRLIRPLQELSCRIEYSEKLISTVVEISDEVAFSILSKEELPRSMCDFSSLSPKINAFLNEYEHPFVILQMTPNTWASMDSRVSVGLLGLFIRLFLEDKQGVLPTRHVKDTALCIKSLAKRVQIEDRPPVLARIKPKANTLFDAQKTLVQGLRLCGPKKTLVLCDIFASPLDIILGIQQSSIVYTKTGNPKGVNGEFADIEGFSWSFLLENQELLNTLISEEPDLNPGQVKRVDLQLRKM